MGSLGVLEAPPSRDFMTVFPMPRRSYQRPTAGPGRPRKYPEGIKFFGANIAGSTYNRLYALKEKLSVPFSELLTWLVDLAEEKIDELELQAKLKHQGDYIQQLEKEKQALLEEREKLIEKIEKLELENQALKQGRSVRSYQDAKMLKALAEKASEGVSWKALCAEVLGLRDENKIKRLLKLAFVVRKDQHNRFPDKFYPKDIAEEFKGWILKRPGEKADIIDYILYREDTLKAAKGLAVGEAAKEKAPEVKPLKTGKAAERWLEVFFEVVHREYMSLIDQKRGKDAKKYLEEMIPEKLEKVLADIDPTDWRRAVLAVLEEHEEDWGDVFVSNLRRVIMRTLSTTKPLEVKADV